MKLMPQVEALESKYAGQVKWAKVEVPRNRRLCMELKVMGLPALLFFREGKEADRASGNVDISSIEDKITKLLQRNC